MRHSLRETWSGIKRNLQMTIAVIITMTVSLTLFGAGLITAQQVELVKDRWYDRIEISVFLCTEFTTGGQCTAGVGTTDAQREEIKAALEANPEVQEVFYESKAEAFEEFQRTFKDSPILDSRTEEQMQDSFRIKLKNPENYEGVVTQANSMQGVHKVQDLRAVLDPIFSWLNGLQLAAFGMSGALLIAAGLQIATTIRMAAYNRRREIGIMRLVGASNVYIMLPFLLESLIAAVVSVLAASGILAAGYHFLIDQGARTSITGLAWIGWSEVGTTILILAVVGFVLSTVPTLLATRRYLKV